ncbi:MAG: DNA helicase UvrD, partial [Gammaproteobacteria bacterium]
MSAEFHLISAGAGSGKTYALTQKLKTLLSSEKVMPAGVIATTFTVRAAAELQERVRQELIATGQAEKANEMGQALIGTVNGVCGELLKRFAFEAGMSPQQKVVDEEEGARLFAQVLESSLETDLALIQQMNAVSIRLGLTDDKGATLWRQEVKNIVSAARSNNISATLFPEFAAQSVESLIAFFPKPTERRLTDELQKAIEKALNDFDPEFDTTKGSATYFKNLKGTLVAIKQRRLTWPAWIKLSKDSPTTKSSLLAEPIQMIASDYSKHPQLQADIRFYIEQVFIIAAKSQEAFQSLKTKLGLVDFVDQEQILLNLLDNPVVQESLQAELQLLMVDEFQDTSPIQLAVFVKLSKLADQVIWVGDIKQSIYGFRGSDPELMLAVIEHIEAQGAKPEILGKSWRSRPPLVKYINNLFTPAFSNTLTEEQVKLDPARPDVQGSAVEFWSIEKINKNKRKRALALASE